MSVGGPPGAVGFTEINQETTMNKTLLALAAATSITVSLLAAPPAEARCWGCAVGIGVAAGVVTGAIVGSAIANSYGPAYVVQPGYTIGERVLRPALVGVAKGGPKASAEPPANDNAGASAQDRDG